MSTMLIKVIADTLLRGVPLPASEEIIEIDAADAVILISAYKAVKCGPPAEGEPVPLPALTLEELEQLPEQEAQQEVIDPHPDQDQWPDPPPPVQNP